MKRYFKMATVLVLWLAVLSCCGCGTEGFWKLPGGEDSLMAGDGNSPGMPGDSSDEGKDRNSGGNEGRGEIAAWQYVDTAMGTVIRQTIYGREENAKAFAGDVMALLTQLESEELSWRLESSEVYRINASAGKQEGCSLSEEMAELLEKCMELSEKAEGSFDVTLGPLSRLWDIDSWAAKAGGEEFQPPSPEAIHEAASLCGGSRLRLEQGTSPRIFLPEGMQLDLGAVGKGAALSRLCKLLEEQTDITGAVISLGGSILTWGTKPGGGAWKVGIVNPLDTSSNIGILSLEGQWCVSTSGDYERYVEADGVRYHHILDPKTGYPAAGSVRGVSILSGDGLVGDGLSTACFILGPEKGIALAAEYGAEALFVMEDEEIIMSDGMKRYFKPL